LSRAPEQELRRVLVRNGSALPITAGVNGKHFVPTSIAKRGKGPTRSAAVEYAGVKVSAQHVEADSDTKATYNWFGHPADGFACIASEEELEFDIECSGPVHYVTVVRGGKLLVRNWHTDRTLILVTDQGVRGVYNHPPLRPPSEDPRAADLKKYQPDGGYWQPMRLPKKLLLAFRQHFSRIQLCMQNPNCLAVVLTDNSCFVEHYLDEKQARLVSYCTCSTFEWRQKRLDHRDPGYGWTVQSRQNPHELLVDANSMGGKFTARRDQGERGTARAVFHHWAGDKEAEMNLLFVLVATGPFRCEAWSIFDSGSVVHQTFSTPNWGAPMILED